MENLPKQKTSQELTSQLKYAERAIGASLRPPHVDLNVLKANIQQLKELYPKRYAFYLEELRREKRGGILGEEEARRMKSWLEAMNSLDEYVYNHHDDPENVTLREHQIPVFEAIRNFFEQGGSKGYLKLPTGSGKTVIFTELIEAMNVKTLVVVPRKVLLQQTVDKMSEFAEDLDVGVVYGKAKQYGRQVTVITYDSFVASVQSGAIDPKEYDLLVLDEVHRGLSEKRQATIQRFSHALQVGFTATPVFSAKKATEQILPTCISEMSIREAVEKGMLCSFVSGVIQTSVDLSGVKEGSNGEYQEHELAMAVDIESRNRAAVDVYKEVGNGDKSVVYCVGVSHSEHVAERFRKEGIPAVMVSGKTPEGELKEILKKFASGEIKVLCNADLLIEGFDDEDVRVCINLRPTRSQVVSEQRGGRVLRLSKKNPNKIALIVDFLDRHGSTGLAGSVLFSDVADDSLMELKHRRRKAPGESGDGSDEKDAAETSKEFNELLKRLGQVNLEGIGITFDVEEILEIRKKRDMQSKEEKFLSYEDFIRETRAAGVKSQDHYYELRRDHTNWPSQPSKSYKDHWTSWDVITGKISTQKKEFLSYEDFVQETRTAGVKNVSHYNKLKKDHPNWPSFPGRTYKNHWIGWKIITGNAPVIEKKFLSYEDFIRETRTAGVKSQDHYYELRRDHTNWPSRPDLVYEGRWVGWVTVTERLPSKSEEFLTYERFLEEVRVAKVRSYVQYAKMKKEHANWPSHPDVTYKDQWTTWEVVTGKVSTHEKEFLSYEDFLKETHAAGVKSIADYNELRKDHPSWPSNPNKTYKDNWKGWGMITTRNR